MPFESGAIDNLSLKRAQLLIACAIALLLLGAFPAAGSAGRWQRQKSGTLAWLHAVYFLDASRGWAAGGNGVLLSTTDSGRNWRADPRPTEDTLQDVYFSDERTGWLVCERNIYLLKTRDEPRSYLMKTSDGGSTWQRVGVVGSDVDARLVRALFTKDGHGWTFGEGGVLYSTSDNGLTWSRQRVPTNYLLLGGALLDNNQGWIVGAGATILQTLDGGETWKRSTDPRMDAVRFAATAFADPLHAWIVGNGGRVYATTDGGETWRSQTTGISSDLLDVKFLSFSEGWAAGKEGTIIHTVDGGSHWSIEQSSTTHPLERLSFAGPNRGWAVGFGGTILSYQLTA